MIFNTKKAMDEGKAIGVMFTLSSVALVMERQGKTPDEIKTFLNEIKVEMNGLKPKEGNHVK